jgi:acetyl-CoA carboxylase biotin carboxyl carrier protein
MILAKDEIVLLVEHMRRTGVAEIEIANGADRLSLALPGLAAPAAPGSPAPARHATTVIAAAACGIFLPCHPMRETGASVGLRVTAGEVVALVAVGALYQPVVAPHGGTLAAILHKPGDRVEFGTPLFELTP